MTASMRAIQSARDAARQREIDERTTKIKKDKADAAEAERLRALSETGTMQALIAEDTDRLLEITMEYLDGATSDDVPRSEQSRSWLSRLARLLTRSRTRP
jgi:predicted AAA+ superfamily ATPase